MPQKKLSPLARTNLRRWLQKLLSGEYVQGRYMLRSLRNEFCALGVLCDQDAQDTETAWEQTRLTEDGDEEELLWYHDCAFAPDEKVYYSQFGENSYEIEQLLFPPDEPSKDITMLNDRYEKSFPEIVGIIRERVRNFYGEEL